MIFSCRLSAKIFIFPYGFTARRKGIAFHVREDRPYFLFSFCNSVNSKWRKYSKNPSTKPSFRSMSHLVGSFPRLLPPRALVASPITAPHGSIAARLVSCVNKSFLLLATSILSTQLNKLLVRLANREREREFVRPVPGADSSRVFARAKPNSLSNLLCPLRW